MAHKFLILCTSLCILSKLFAQESIENFFEYRQSLYPPTIEDQEAVLQTVKDFLDKVNVDLSVAYYVNTSKQFQASTSFGNFSHFIQDIVGIDFSNKLDLRQVTFLNNEKTKANFTVLVDGKKKGQRFYVEFYLENDDNTWEIMNIKIYQISSRT